MLKRICLVAALVTQLIGCALAAPVNEDHLRAQAKDGARKPNVIIILADDLGFGDLSSYGATLISTPNIDRLADEGVRMTSFYAGANVCSPSRASLLTGRYPIRSGMQFVIRPHSAGGLPAEEITIAELLRNAGYATGMIGKWHLGHQAEYWPTRQGFDSFYGVAYSNDMMPFDLYEGTEIVESPVDQTQLTPKYTDAAIRFIEENADQPFFLYYAENLPHIPLFYPLQNAGRSDAGEYGDVVETLDDAVGEVLNALDRLD
ncbi:MAG TPA: sulfatase-like hydrolase/transferase, partial [Woeseiaceae bacterium]